MKRIIFLATIHLLCCSITLGQIKFQNDLDYEPWRLDPEFDSVFKISRENDFELRIITEPSTFIPGRKITLFIMTLNNTKWTARVLQRFGYSKDEYLELKINNLGLINLWKELLKQRILTIPESYLLTDKKGEILRTNAKDGVTYRFELITKTAKRNYSYYCPQISAEDFPRVRPFKQVSKIVELITNYYKPKSD